MSFITIPLEVLHRYAGRRLVVKAYDSDPENDFFAGDFLTSENLEYAFSEIDSNESDLSYEGASFFKESFWNTLETPHDVIVSLQEIDPLYEKDELASAPFAILFSQMPIRETSDKIAITYGSEIQPYIDTCSRRINSITQLMESIDPLFELEGYTVLRNWRYRKIFPNYWFHILLQKKDYVFEFEPIISMAPLVEGDSMKQPYHDWHERTKRFKCLTNVRLAEENSDIDPQFLKNFKEEIEIFLTELNNVSSDENELLKYLQTELTSIP